MPVNDASKPTILMVVNNLRWFLTHRLPIAKEAMRRGWRIAVVAPASPDRNVVEAEGVDVHELPLPRGLPGAIAEFRALTALVRLYKNIRPDVVHHVTLKPVLLGSLAARIARTPSVVNAIAGLGSLFLASGWRAAVLRSVLRTGLRVGMRHPNTRTIFQNSDDLSEFLARGIVREDEARLIRGAGVDLDIFTPAPLPPGIPLVVVPARILRDKGVLEFVAAAEVLRSRGIESRFALVGGLDSANPSALSDTELRSILDARIVEWWGERDDMPDVLRAARIVVLPSYREGLPKALLEASACARPIITTDVPGCREAVENGITGLLVPAQDSNALADAIEWLLTHPVEAAAFGAAGRRRVEECFSQHLVAASTVDIYAELHFVNRAKNAAERHPNPSDR